MRNGRTDAILGLGLDLRILFTRGYGFAKDKGDWWMTEDSYVDTRVREFADHIQCDPELAQELYFEHKVSEALDNEQKASVDRELSTLRIVIVG